MRIFKTLFIAIATTMLVASSASALVTITASSAETGPLTIGQSFDVDITLAWDGTGSLTGVFASHVWDNAQLALVNAEFIAGTMVFETRPVPLKGTSYAPNLTRFGTIAAGISGDDLTSTARTVQYGSLDPLTPGQAGSDLITTLTFQVVGVGDGVAEVTGALLPADGVTDTVAFVNNVAVAIPEPGTALLMGLGLAGLATAGRRNG